METQKKKGFKTGDFNKLLFNLHPSPTNPLFKNKMLPLDVKNIKWREEPTQVIL